MTYDPPSYLSFSSVTSIPFLKLNIRTVSPSVFSSSNNSLKCLLAMNANCINLVESYIFCEVMVTKGFLYTLLVCIRLKMHLYLLHIIWLSRGFDGANGTKCLC